MSAELELGDLRELVERIAAREGPYERVDSYTLSVAAGGLGLELRRRLPDGRIVVARNELAWSELESGSFQGCEYLGLIASILAQQLDDGYEQALRAREEK